MIYTLKTTAAEQETFVNDQVKQRIKQLKMCLDFWEHLQHTDPRSIPYYYRLFQCCLEQVTGFEQNFVIQKDIIDFDKLLIPFHCTDKVVDKYGVSTIIPWSSKSDEILLKTRKNMGLKLFREGISPLVTNTPNDQNLYVYHAIPHKYLEVDEEKKHQNLVKYFREQTCCIDTAEFGKTLLGHSHVPPHLLIMQGQQQQQQQSPSDASTNALALDERDQNIAGPSSSRAQNVVVAEMSNSDEVAEEVSQRSLEGFSNTLDEQQEEDHELERVDEVVLPPRSLMLEAVGWKDVIKAKPGPPVPEKKIREGIQLLSLGTKPKDVVSATAEEIPEEEEAEELDTVDDEPSTSTRNVSNNATKRKNKIKQQKAQEKAMEQKAMEEKKKEELKLKIRIIVRKNVDRTLQDIEHSNWEDIRTRTALKPLASGSTPWFETFRTTRINDRRTGTMIKDHLSHEVADIATKALCIIGFRKFLAYSVKNSKNPNHQKNEILMIDWSFFGFFDQRQLEPSRITEASVCLRTIIDPALHKSKMTEEQIVCLGLNVIKKRIQYYTENPEKIRGYDVKEILELLSKYIYFPELVSNLVIPVLGLYQVPSVEKRSEENIYLMEFEKYLAEIYD